MEPDPVSPLARDGCHREQQGSSRPPTSERRASDPGPRKTRARVPAANDPKRRCAGVENVDSSLGAFSRLPEEVIERILYAVDANVFASLTLLNKKWRRISASSTLYYHHLLGCRTLGSAGHDPASGLSATDDLKILEARFIREARRNTFDVFLRPTQMLINLVSASASSSSAFPQGEAFRFDFSSNGRQLLALSSSRIYVIDLTTHPVSVRQELKTLRRPLAAAIANNGTVLAMVSSEHQAHIYLLMDGHAELMQSIELSEVPRALAFSPDAVVLAVAYDGGLEMYAIGTDVLSTARRAVRCFGVDYLTFCCQGSMLLGTANDLHSSKLVTISPPLGTDPNAEFTMQELESRMWTTQILFPQVHDGYSHAVLIPTVHGGDGSPWFSGYHLESKAFRLAPIDNPNTAAIYFVGPGPDTDRDEPKPHFLPAASGNGELLAIGFQESELWVYGIPNIENHVATDSSAQPSTNSQEREPVWKSDSATTNFNRLKKTIEGPKTFVHGHPLPLPDGVSAIKWVCSSSSGDVSSQAFRKLVAVAPGGVSSWLGAAAGDMLPIDGGRIIVFDFQLSVSNGQKTEITIELGEVEPIKLPEPGSDLDQQVELERRRTRLNRRRGLGGLQIPTSASTARRHLQPSLNGDGGLGNLTLLDNPYNNSSPRSRDTLNRAATAASNRLNPRYHNARQVQSGVRAPRATVPHESDADNWIPPPPPYTPNAEAPLPEHLQRTLLPTIRGQSTSNNADQSLRRSRTSRLESMAQAVIQRSSTRVNREPNDQAPALLYPSNTFPINRQNLPTLNTTNSSLGYPPRSPSATSSPQHSPNTHVDPNDGPSHPTTETSQQNTQHHSSMHAFTPQALPSATSSQPPMQHANRSPNTNPARAPSPQTAPVTSRSSNTRSLPLAPTGTETRGWYNIRPQSNTVDFSTTSNRPAPPVISGLRAHTQNNTSLSPNSALRGRNHGVQRSRSRSQDAPRIAPLSNTGYRDRRTGRSILGLQSDFRLNQRTRSDDWPNLTSTRSGRKESKCVMM
ncbi:predicted protein [Uncinocarpus reesii 1704]|uniref:F-box domain-containing protein n=1 Tax=Uncinocarpus reesii (strain UAMH 1704) TaxID=336963 RepID=C4JJC5_UNCRE|nr:uncharacterized protein UREG_01732 [Uncinocarpus reesii 1704]EEP76883.1 predicted protein [Uncinocarpus reesii 1704]